MTSSRFWRRLKITIIGGSRGDPSPLLRGARSIFKLYLIDPIQHCPFFSNKAVLKLSKYSWLAFCTFCSIQGPKIEPCPPSWGDLWSLFPVDDIVSINPCPPHSFENYVIAPPPPFIPPPNLLSWFMASLRRGTCLALRFQTGSWMLFIDSRNSNKLAAFYTVHTSSIRIFNCLYFPDVTLKTY